MNKIRLCLGYCLFAMVVAGAAAFAAAPGSPPAAGRPGHPHNSHPIMPKPGTGNIVQSLVHELRSSGLKVSVGYPMLYAQADCAYSYPVYSNCFGNNPESPYVVPVVKSWPDEYVDPAMDNGMGKTLPGYSSTFRLDPKEAIIIFGKMPPPARYLGLQTWIWTTGWVRDDSPWDMDAYNYFKDIAGDLIQYLFTTFPVSDNIPDPSEKDQYRVQSFSSINNNINNVVMEEQSGEPPWNEIRYFVITPDQRMDEVVRDVLESLGVDGKEVFTEGIPSTFQGNVFADPIDQDPVVGPLGLGKEAVDFWTAFRYAMPDNELAARVWRKRLPLTVLRVRRMSGPDPSPYPHREADDRYGKNESDFSADLDALVDAVIDRADSQGLRLAPPPDGSENPQNMIDLLNGLEQFGPACRNIGMNCLGDNQDASYFLFKPRPLDTGLIYAVVGTLATETGNGTYVGLSVNDASMLKGVLNVSDTKLKGSARSYGLDHRFGHPPRWSVWTTKAQSSSDSAAFGGLRSRSPTGRRDHRGRDCYREHNDSDKFFVHFFTRDCDAIAYLTDGSCTTITEEMVPLAGDDNAPGDDDLHGKFSAAVRAYVAEGFERGPDPSLHSCRQFLSRSTGNRQWRLEPPRSTGERLWDARRSSVAPDPAPSLSAGMAGNRVTCRGGTIQDLHLSISQRGSTNEISIFGDRVRHLFGNERWNRVTGRS